MKINSERIAWFLVGFLAVQTLFGYMDKSELKHQIREIQRQAIINNAAHYSIDKDGGARFTWGR